MASECEAHDSCGHFDYSNMVCNNESAKFNDDCNNLNGWKKACEA